jgi:large subunit ribosomal protein L23
MGILDRIRQTDDSQATTDVKVEKKVATKSKAKAATLASVDTRVIVRPLITEKAALLNALNQYVFEVTPTANKIMVARAIEKLFGVKPVSVNINNRRGKERVRGRIKGTTSKLRKAIVTLPAGKSISAAEAK